MNRKWLHEALVAEICQATQSVFSTMLGLDVEAGAPTADSPGPGPIGGMSAMITIVGPWTGAGVVSCSERMACRLAGAMLLSEFDKVDDDVLDAMGEIGNMIIGNVKTSLEATLGPLALGVPTVTYGRDYATRSTMKQTWSLVPFQCEGQDLFVQVLLAEISQVNSSRLPHRTLAEVGA